MLGTSFSPWPCFTQEEANAVARVLLSNKVNYWTGEECRKFESEFATSIGVNHAVALANGTVALEAALLALGVGSGDEVVVSPRTFLASASSIVNVGAIPVFADVDPDTQNITDKSIAAVLSAKTRAVICVHLAGMPCDMDPILTLCEQHGLFVVEDCAQAHGAAYKGRPVGSIGDIAAWSFCQDKIMSTGGEGGMVTTNSRDLWSRVWSIKDHGKQWEAVYEKSHAPGFRWLHESFGSNYRMTEMQAAIGRIQLSRLPAWSRARSSNAQRIWEAARHCPVLRVPSVASWAQHGAYKCYVFVRPDRLPVSWTRDRIVEEINQNGVPCYVGSCSEVYLEKAFDECPSDGRTWRPAERLPVARNLGETSLMFLVHPTLSDDEVETTCRVLRRVCEPLA